MRLPPTAMRLPLAVPVLLVLLAVALLLVGVREVADGLIWAAVVAAALAAVLACLRLRPLPVTGAGQRPRRRESARR